MLPIVVRLLGPRIETLFNIELANARVPIVVRLAGSATLVKLVS